MPNKRRKGLCQVTVTFTDGEWMLAHALSRVEGVSLTGLVRGLLHDAKCNLNVGRLAQVVKRVNVRLTKWEHNKLERMARNSGMGMNKLVDDWCLRFGIGTRDELRDLLGRKLATPKSNLATDKKSIAMTFRLRYLGVR